MSDRKLPDIIEEIDRKALAGLCQMSTGGKHEFLKDIRKLVTEAAMLSAAQAPTVEQVDATAPVDIMDRWVIAQQTSVEVLGRLRLGYTIVDKHDKQHTGLFETYAEASTALAESGRPLGWVAMQVSQLWEFSA